MGIKTFMSILTLYFAFYAFGGELEEQRKYIAADSAVFIPMLQNNAPIDGFKTHFHSAYTYFDLYLDTPELLLYKNGYSMRLRKRIFSETEIGYGFQLKSEMTDYGSIRLEVEESELDFYQVPFKDDWISLADLLDLLFDTGTTNLLKTDTRQAQECIVAIQEWIKMKAGAPIAPFQKLRSLNSVLFTEATIQTIEPMLIGKSKRNRIHVYIVNEKGGIFNDIPNNPIPKSELPPFFIENEKAIWVMESSLDYSVFYPLFESDNQQVIVQEYEVENKYKVLDVKRQLIELYNRELIDKMQLIPELASKYKQAMQQF